MNTYLFLKGIIFSVKVVPLQRKILYIGENKPVKEFSLDLYRSRLQEWETSGLLALVTPVASMIMIVLKIPVMSGL